MKKFLIGVVAGFLLAGLAGVIVVLALARASDRKPSVADGSTLVLRLQGEVVEVAPVEIPIPFFETQSPVTMLEVWDVLRKAEADSRIKAIALEPQGLSVGWAKLDEIRSGLLRFKRSGKPIHCYLRNPGAREYYLATVADRILMAEDDLLNVKGMRVEVSYYKKGLEKLGIEFESERAGKYKDAADQFVRTDMAPETREVFNSILDQIYGHMVGVIAQARKKTPDEIRAAIDNGPFLAKQALAAGFIDGVGFEDQYLDELKTRLKQSELKRVALRDYVKIPASSLGLGGRARIAVISGQGAILRGGLSGFAEESEAIMSAPFIKLLRQVAKDASIRGVILRVDSPGGDAIASDEILREVKLLSQKKPLVVSMSDVAASGGYFIAMSGDPVLAYPNTVTGSIGVIYMKPNLKGLYEKLGIGVETLTRGRNADIDSVAKPMSPAARQKLREGIDQVYQTFLARVAGGRKRKVEDIHLLAQGRVWMGQQAKGNGLLDELGGIDRAIEMVKGKANIAAGEKVQIVTYPSKKSVFESLMGASAEALVESAVRSRVRALAPGVDLHVLSLNGILRVMPFSVQVD